MAVAPAIGLFLSDGVFQSRIIPDAAYFIQFYKIKKG
jgi:hypothetical protein